jgi:hypothetical protein
VIANEHTIRVKTRDRVIQGTFDQATSTQNPARLPRTYKATLTIAEKVVIPESW